MLYVVLILAGMGIGIVLTNVFRCRKSIGFLRIDRSDPYDKPYMFLELKNNQNIADICKADFVTLQVKVENYISQD